MDVVQVSGEFEIGSQYHFHLETQSVIVRPGNTTAYSFKDCYLLSQIEPKFV